MRTIALATLAAVGCLGSNTTVCDNGATCPDGLACTEQTPIVCGEPANVDACAGSADHTACSSSVEPMGTCASGVCTACSPELIECRYDGWTAMQSPTTQQLNAVWAASQSDVYAVGNGGIALHYDGVAWKSIGPLGSSSMAGVWGSEPHDVYAVSGSDALVYHYDGAAWSSSSESLLHGIWGARGDDIFAVGIGGVILHYDGSWTQQANTPPTLNSVWGASTTNVLAVGNSGAVTHFNGSAWQAMPTIGTTSTILFSVWISPAGRAFVVGSDGTMGLAAIQDGGTWNRQDSANALRGVFGLADNDVVAVGGGGTVTHYDGAAWSPMTSGTLMTLYAISGAGNELFAVGEGGTILRYSRK